ADLQPRLVRHQPSHRGSTGGLRSDLLFVLLGVLATMMASRHIKNTDSRNTDQTQHDPRGQTSTLRRAKRNKVMKCATLLVCLEGAIGVGTYVEWFHSGDVTPIDMNLLALGNSSIDGLSARIDVFPNNLSVHMEGH